MICMSLLSRSVIGSHIACLLVTGYSYARGSGISSDQGDLAIFLILGRLFFG
jgi:hypothetical protein